VLLAHPTAFATVLDQRNLQPIRDERVVDDAEPDPPAAARLERALQVMPAPPVVTTALAVDLGMHATRLNAVGGELAIADEHVVVAIKSDRPTYKPLRPYGITGTTSMSLDLDPEEERALAAELRRLIADDRYPFSPRIRTLQGILDKLDPPPVRKPLPRPKGYPPPRQRRRRR
jgi:hypothetical protein